LPFGLNSELMVSTKSLI